MSLERANRSLSKYSPRLTERRFWIVQGLVLLIAGVHTTFEVLRYLGHPTFLGTDPPVAFLSFVPVSLFFIPVVYAALNFGFRGAVATAAWCTVITLPNFFLHPGMERVREMSQVGIVDILAFFVGQRVDREWAARQQAETARLAMMASETKYRGVFESSPISILVLDPTGVVLDANPAAARLFGNRADGLQGTTLPALLGSEVAAKVLASSDSNNGNQPFTFTRQVNGSDVYLEPAVTPISDKAGRPAIQALLRDVTEEQQRQAGLKAYAAHILRAQEEERRRIAQEIHDETVQKLVLICRQLDAIESASSIAPASAVEDVRNTRKATEEVVHGLRDFARSLRPPTLDDLGLVTSIRRLLVDMSERTHIESQMKVTGQQRRMLPDIEVGLFRIAQETLRNVERHSHANRVTVTLAFGDGRVTLEVVDNGVGFIPPLGTANFAARRQLGLLGMRERAELLGGRLEVQSTPGKGTSLFASIPVQ